MNAFHLWRLFPVAYVLPFLLASCRFEALTAASDLVRWCVLAAGCAFALQLGLRRAGQRNGLVTAADQWMLAFLLLFAMSASWSISPRYTVLRFMSIALLYGSSMWAFWAYADQFTEEYLMKSVLRTLGLAMATNLLVGIPLFPNELFQGRFQGLFLNANNIGILVGLALPAAMGRWLRTRERPDLLVAAIMAANLLLCGTRSAMLGVIMAAAIIGGSIGRRRPVWVTLILACVLVMLAWASQTRFFDEEILRRESLATGSNRTYFWDLGKQYSGRRPWLGHGFASDASVNEYYGVVLKDLELRGYGVMSSYHGMAVQIGRPLTYLFFGLLWGFVIRSGFRFWQDAALVVHVATLASGLVICIFEPALYSAGNCFAFLFWMVFMLTVRRTQYHRHNVIMVSSGVV